MKPKLKKNKLASVEVLSYIENVFRWCYQDCSDSYHECEKYRHRFEALTEDRVKIADYIRAFHLNDYVVGLQEFQKENPDYDMSDPSVMDTPLPWKEVAGLVTI
jgi:hypothetical protein